jgi:hypothetical protein
MDQQTLLYIMTAFVAIAAISLLLQLATLFGLYRTAKQMQEKTNELLPKVHELLPKVHSIVDSSQKAVEQSRQHIQEIAAKANALAAQANSLLDSGKAQMVKVDELVTDATGRAKVQLERAEMVLDDTMSRAHETVALVHNGVTRPLREINGLAAGIRTAVAHLARGGRPSVAQATHDEEMFI